ncbi:coiled-coil domain-containing protein 60-like isoform X1 [Heteronotia binoei]|uniref:coiled-coil domain-containing protein 60-like isoform X1 n=1 Tax=Heteronotia binoei TaxID=13085 RepID=UPI0029309D7B|nr:coiled-coil domain-containing protein 60-like isoform X1 [Heteronotia binoei]
MPANPKTDPRYFVLIKPLPIPTQKGLKVQARSSTVYNCWDNTREHVFRENYRRRVKQVTQQGYFTPSWRPYQDFGEPLYLEPKRLTLHGLGQLPPELLRDDVCSALEEVVELEEPSSVKQIPTKEPEKKPVHFRYLEKDLRSLHKDLVHTRHLINSVKMGRGYFHMIHRETLERKNMFMLEQEKEDQRRRTEFQPPKYPGSSSSEEDISDEEITDFFLTECPLLRESEKKKKKIIRPFTPVHNGLIASKHPEAHFESLFRQLCALHWFLEALTVEPNISMKPLITCWNAKDYGGGRNSFKVVNKEKNVKARWEHFLTHTKGRRYTQKTFRGLGPKKLSKKASTMSLSKMSGLSSPHSKTTLGSTSSLTPGSEEVVQHSSDGAKEGEEMDSSYGKPTKEVKEEEEPMSYYLQTLLQMIHEDVAKNFSKEYLISHPKPPSMLRSDPESDLSIGQRVKSSHSSSKEERNSSGLMREETPVEQKPKSSLAVQVREDKTTTATYKKEDSAENLGRPHSSFIRRKVNLCNEMRELFYDVTLESAFRLHDQLDILERRREEKSVQKYRCLKQITKLRKDLERMRQAALEHEPKQDAEEENWFVTLLDKIPDDVMADHRTQKVLKKLEKFARNPDLRIRPPTFLKVLGELRVWEICSPDICAAIQFLRENIVGMPEEDYKQWLQSRVPIQKRARSAPPL